MNVSGGGVLLFGVVNVKYDSLVIVINGARAVGTSSQNENPVELYPLLVKIVVSVNESVELNVPDVFDPP